MPRLIEELWGMKLMSTRNAHARDGIAGSLLEAFDFNQSPRAPTILPRGRARRRALRFRVTVRVG